MGLLSPILRNAGDLLIWHCPGCKRAHSIRNRAASAPGEHDGPGWGWNGNAERPTFTPSVLVTYDGPDAGQDQGDGHTAPPAVCHSFVVDGAMQFLSDCTHALAGQTVPIPAWPQGALA
jgi:hypothetical protein